MQLTKFSAAAISASVIAFAATGAMAAVNTYSGADDNSPVGGPNPNSTAAEASFLAGAASYGPTKTETFSNVALGYGPWTLVGGVGLTITGLQPQSPGEDGVNVSSQDNILGYDIGGDAMGRWLGFVDGGSVTFTFSSLQHSFGFYTTGTKASLNPTFSVNDGTNNFVVASNGPLGGGASYFGYTDSAGFTSVTITSAVGEDLWGIDNVSYNAVPEPATWAMMILGMGGLGATLRRNRRRIAMA